MAWSTRGDAEPPTALYIYPAGGQRGTTVEFKVGGMFLAGKAGFTMSGDGVEAFGEIREVETLWFPGPLVTGQTASSGYDYPKDHAGVLRIAESAPTGLASWRLWTSQGGTPARVFEVGELPEILEDEIDGPAVPTEVELPITINGRVYPREDTDLWSFDCRAGESYRVEVSAARLGSPLDARLEILGPAGESIAENLGTYGADPVVFFRAEQDGIHQVRLDDVGYSGGQTFVYRLTLEQRPQVDWVYPLGGRRGDTTPFQVGVRRPDTGSSEADVEPQTVAFALAASGTTHQRLPVGDVLSNPILLEGGSLPERLEAEPNDLPAEGTLLALPVVANGQIAAAGDVDHWRFAALAGERIPLALVAARLGSRLEPQISVLGPGGEEVATVTATGPDADRHLDFVPASDGIYTVQVRERFASRGGPAFGYRLRLGRAHPELRLTLATETLRMFRGAGTSLGVRVERPSFPGHAAEGPVRLKVEGLPPGVEVTGLDVPADKSQAQIAFKATDGASIGGTRVRVLGTLSTARGIAGEGATLRSVARRSLQPGGPVVDDVLVCVGLKTPFKIKGMGGYYQRAHRGSVKHYPFRVIERGDYEGPLTIMVSDKQRRHLQGVFGFPLTLEPGVVDFDYPFHLPSEMSISRVARLLVVAIGEVTEPDGTRHKLIYYNQEEAQAVVNVTSGRLGIQVARSSVSIASGQPVPVAVRVERGTEISGPIDVELVVPPHLPGLRSHPLRIPADEEHGSLVLELSREWPEEMPTTMPLLVRATGDENGWPVVADAQIELVSTR